MARFIYFLVCIALIAGGALFVLKRPDGQPWLSIPEPSVPSLDLTLDNHVQQLTQQVKSLTTSANHVLTATSDEQTQVFRWQDINGQWHYSDTPNPDGQSEAVILKASDVTVLAPETFSLQSVSNKASHMQMLPTLSQPFERISQAQETLQEAKNIQQLVDDRKEQLDQQIKQSQ